MSEKDIQDVILDNLTTLGLKMDTLQSSVSEIKTSIAVLDARVTRLECKEPENTIKKRFAISTTGQYLIIVIAVGSLAVAIASLLMR